MQNWVDKGKLKCYRTAGGHRRLDRGEVSQFIQNQFQPKDFQPKAPAQNLNDDADILRILIVEDDFSLLRLCELKFSQFSIPHKLYLTHNAFQGLIMVGKFQPHLIFTDLKMPQINGLQMINEIIALPDMSQSKIIVMTGLPIHEIKQMGRIPDGLTVLPKPIPFNTIETILYQQAQTLSLRLDPIPDA